MNSLSEVDRTEWNTAAARCGLYLSYDWLLAEERRDDADSSFLLVHRTVDDRIVAALPLSLVRHEPGEHYHPHRLRLPGAPEGEFGLIGSRRGYRSGVVMNTEDDRERRQAGLLLAAAIQDFISRHAVPVYALYVPEDLVRDVLAIPGCTRAANLGSEAYLPLAGESYDELVERMPRKRRQELRRERRRFREIGYETAVEPPKGLEPEMARLLWQLEARYGTTNQQSFYEGYYERLTRSADPGLVLTCRTGGDLVGFCHFYVFGHHLWCRTTGFDYPRLSAAFEYFNIAFFEMSEVAETFGARSIHYGTGSIEAKVNHGALVGSLWAITFDGPDGPRPFEDGP